MDKNQKIKINENASIPIIGFGTYLVPNEGALRIVGDAIKIGYRHIDTAEGYKNEEGVGQAINSAIKNGVITRDDLFVTTKVWPGNPAFGEIPASDFKNYDDTLKACDVSLGKLKLDYVDLFLVHAPTSKETRIDQCRALIELKKQGKIKSYGVSNFGIKHINEIKSAGIALPEANQIEIHPWSQKNDYIKFLNENSILPIAYSSLVPLSSWRSKPGEPSGKTDQLREEGKNEDFLFKILAKKYNVTESQILLRWAIQKGYPVIPKSVSIERITENYDLFGFNIDKDDMDLILKQDKGGGLTWEVGEPLDFP